MDVTTSSGRMIPQMVLAIPERLKTDYEHMKNMIFGETPEFKEILSALEDLEKAINSLPTMG